MSDKLFPSVETLNKGSEGGSSTMYRQHMEPALLSRQTLVLLGSNSLSTWQSCRAETACIAHLKGAMKGWVESVCRWLPF